VCVRVKEYGAFTHICNTMHAYMYTYIHNVFVGVKHRTAGRSVHVRERERERGRERERVSE